MSLVDVAFKCAEGRRYHGGAVAYALLAYGLGLAGLFSDAWLVMPVRPCCWLMA